MVAVVQPIQAQPYRLIVGAIVFVLQLSMGLSFIAVAPLFPLITADYGVSSATVSLLVAATALAVAVGMIPAGILSAKLGWQRSMLLGGALMSLVLLTPVAPNFITLLGLRIGFAVGASIMMATTPAVLMRWFPPNELPIANGVNLVGQSLGVTTSVLLAAYLADGLGWRAALMVFGAVPFAGTVAWALLVREPEQTGELEAPSRLSIAELGAAVRERTTLVLGMGVAGGIGAFLGLSSWLPTYYHEEFGFSLERAGRITAMLPLFGIAGSITGSALTVRLGRRKPLILASGVIVPIAAIGSFITAEPVMLYASVAVLGIGAMLWFPAALTIPLELPGVTPERATVATATILSVGNLSGFVVPLLVGALHDLTGSYFVGLVACAIVPLMLTLSGLLVPETGKGRALSG
ncbi:MAG: MFS transporter [Chloroflexi bacterium]|nr:MFS transporter [Chloroflexota bacterium]